MSEYQYYELHAVNHGGSSRWCWSVLTAKYETASVTVVVEAVPATVW